MAAIFISYRRIDSKAYAGRLFDRLNQHFGEDHVFMDVEGGIQRGEDFASALQRAVESVDAMIILIGRQWLTCSGPNGQRRIDQPDDWVRQETAIALRRGILVLPVLVDGASMPVEAELPEDIRLLARRQASEISDTRWGYDVSQIIATLEHLMRRPFWRRTPRRKAGLALVGLTIVAAIGFALWRPTFSPISHSPVMSSPPTPASSAAASAPPIASSSAAVPVVPVVPVVPAVPTDLTGLWRDADNKLYQVVATSDGGFDMGRIEPPDDNPVYRKIHRDGRDVSIAIGVLPSGTQQAQADLELSVDGRMMSGLLKSTQTDDPPANWVLRRASK